ncbi:MAG: hypothetical protein KC422_21800 [Trueperaceae bacterium]|nr:hypothetical protein [Trueperaceae bacterium]
MTTLNQLAKETLAKESKANSWRTLLKALYQAIKSIFLSLLFLLIGLFTFGQAQYMSLDKIQGQYVAYLEQMQHLMNQSNQNTQLGWAEVIATYRQQTGDYQTSDDIIKQYAMNKYYAENPQAWLAQLQFEQNQFNVRQNAINDANNTVNNLIINGWEANQQVVDTTMDRYSPQAVQGNANYLNPYTGQVYTLPFTAPGSFQIGNDFFFLDDYGQYFQYTANGWTLLNLQY